MTLKDVLLKPIKLIGGGVLDLKGFRKSIIDKKLGNDEPELPYDIFQVPDIEFGGKYNSRATEKIVIDHLSDDIIEKYKAETCVCNGYNNDTFIKSVSTFVSGTNYKQIWAEGEHGTRLAIAVCLGNYDNFTKGDVVLDYYYNSSSGVNIVRTALKDIILIKYKTNE